jgi:hypothetical protein
MRGSGSGMFIERSIRKQSLRKRSFGKSFGELDQDAAVGGIRDLVECDDQPQAFENVEVDLIFAEQSQQLVRRWFAIVRAHA